MQNKIYNLNNKIDQIKVEQRYVPEAKKETLLSLLDEDDKLTIKQSFCNKHHDQMEKRFPSGVMNLTITEKECFNFIHSIDFENSFFNSGGWGGRQKSNFDTYDANMLGEQKDGMQAPNGQGRYEDIKSEIINNSIFADFLEDTSSTEKKV